MVKLSDRLKCVAGLITPGLTVADIGCDHGYLPIYLVQNGISESVIASDVNVGPLEKAIDNIEMYGLSKCIDTRLSNGLKMFEPSEAQCIVMAGMGGNLVIDIMVQGSDITDSAEELILQPQSDIERVRRYLQSNGFMIISEAMVFEDGKFYPMMKAIHGEQHWDRDIYFVYGKILLREQNPVLHQFLIQEKDYLVDLYSNLSCAEQTEHVRQRLSEVERKLTYNEEALEMITSENPVEIDRVLK